MVQHQVIGKRLSRLSWTCFSIVVFLIFSILPYPASFAASDKPKIPTLNYGQSRSNSSILASREALEDFVKKQCIRYGIPYLLAMSIMGVDSGVQAWKVTVGKHEYFPQTKDEALFILKNSPGRDYNLGIMQVHSRWLQQWGIPPDQAVEPHINIQLALYILNESFQAHGGISGKGVVEYHQQQGGADQDYARQILIRYRTLRQREETRSRVGHYDMFEKHKN